MATAAGLWHALARLAPRLPGDDGELLAQFAATRDGPAFHELMRRHGKLVWAVCRRQLQTVADAEDAFQATWLVLATKPHAVRRGEALPSWLHGTAWKVAARLRQQRRRLQPLPNEGEVAAPTPDNNRESLTALDEELTRLPAKLRDPLTACYLLEQTQDEAAAALGLSVSTVQRRLAAGRELLRTRLTRRGVELGAALALLTLPTRDAPATLVELTLTAATAGPLPAALAPLVPGVLTMIWPAKMKSYAVGVGMVARATAGVGTLATPGHGQGPGGPPAATKPAEPPPAKAEPAKSPADKLRPYSPSGTPAIEELEFDIARAKLQIERADLVAQQAKFADVMMKQSRISSYEATKSGVEALQAAEYKLVAEGAMKLAERRLAELKGQPSPPATKPASDAARKLQEKRRATAKADFESVVKYFPKGD